MRIKALSIFAAVCFAAAHLAAQQPPRDTRPADKIGTASISGVVTSDEAQPRPLRRARVTLNGPELAMGRTSITADDGSFTFERLPAGRYTLAAAKEAYVRMSYGARRPNAQGTPVAVADGQRQRVTLRIPRGSVITGTVLDPEGQPMRGVLVSALTYRFVPGVGERRLVSAGAPSSATDDRGEYRIFGLPAGGYVISAGVEQFSVSSLDIRVVPAGEIQQALSERQGGPPQAPAQSPSAATTKANEPRRTVAYAPVYYPGTAVSAQASTVTVAPGEERTGIDIQMQYVPTAKIEGMVISAAALPQVTPVMLNSSDPTLAVDSVRVASAGPDGRFTFNAVPPGQYNLIVRPVPLGAMAGAPRPQPAAPGAVSASMYWALGTVAVQGEDLAGVTLTLQPGLTISGRVVFEGATPPAIDFSQVRVPVPPLRLAVGNLPIPSPMVRLDATGRFTIGDVIPGPYRLTTTAQGMRSPIGAWWLKSVVAGGRDLLDSVVDIRQSIDDVVVTFSDRATELSGTVTDAQGNPASNAFALVFAADSQFWFTDSRRIAGVRPDADGRFTIRNLPPGTYLAVASADVDDREWFDPEILQRLAPLATKLSLAEGERKTLDVTVR